MFSISTDQEINDRQVRTLMKSDRLACLRFARQWISLYPDYTHARAMYAWILNSTMDHAAAVTQWQHCLHEQPSRIYHQNLGWAHWKLGDYEHAMQHWLQTLEYPDHVLNDKCHEVIATAAAGYRDFARAIHFTDREVLNQPTSIFCEYLLNSTHANKKAACRDRLLGLGDEADLAIHFMRLVDAHAWGEIDHKGRLAELVSRSFDTCPNWWPETMRWPAQGDEIQAALNQNPSSTWIFKPSNLVATQGHRIGCGTLRDWTDAEDLALDAVVQRYMEHPYLVEGRKFNIRLQVCMNAPYADAAWLWRDGLVFISTSPYDPSSSATDRAAHLVNPVSGARDLLNTPIGPYAAPGLGLQRFMELTFDAGKRARVEEAIRHVAAEVAAMLERGGVLERVRNIPYWRAFAPKYFGIDLSFDADLNPWVFELERYTGMGIGSPSAGVVLTQFRRDWLPFALGHQGSEGPFLQLGQN